MIRLEVQFESTRNYVYKLNETDLFVLLVKTVLVTQSRKCLE